MEREILIEDGSFVRVSGMKNYVDRLQNTKKQGGIETCFTRRSLDGINPRNTPSWPSPHGDQDEGNDDENRI
jgi:hypothetical protein